VAGNTLRILTVERFGEIFNQQSMKLAYTPRKSVCAEKDVQYLICAVSYEKDVQYLILYLVIFQYNEILNDVD